ncbi:MAG: DUF1801 domain-containing protein [Gemmatimonadetes bacterium]|nr:DUF1801 domain-containing protein [Gemmatimonadota bacterium]
MTKRKAPVKAPAAPAAQESKTSPTSKAGAEPKVEVTPEDILKGCSPGVRRIAEEVRSLMRHVVPTSTEKAYPGWHGIGFRDPQAGYVFGLFPQPDHVRLFFERGAELEDPDGVFAPADGLKQGRYIELRTVIDAKKPSLRRMIIRAVVNQSV